MVGPMASQGQCELVHIAVAALRALWWWEQHRGLRNEKVVGSDSPTLLVEYRSSSWHIQQSAWSSWTPMLQWTGL